MDKKQESELKEKMDLLSNKVKRKELKKLTKEQKEKLREVIEPLKTYVDCLRQKCVGNESCENCD